MIEWDAPQPRKLTLSRQITDIAQVQEMDNEELIEMRSLHETEITSIANRIEADPFADNVQALITSIKYVKLHLRWIREEMRNRTMDSRVKIIIANNEKLRLLNESKLAEKQLKAEKHAEKLALKELELKELKDRKKREHEEKLERVRISNARDEAQNKIFKGLVRELVGDVAYIDLWKKVDEITQGAEKS